MINRDDEQFFKIQLKRAADAFNAERTFMQDSLTVSRMALYCGPPNYRGAVGGQHARLAEPALDGALGAASAGW